MRLRSPLILALSWAATAQAFGTGLVNPVSQDDAGWTYWDSNQVAAGGTTWVPYDGGAYVALPDGGWQLEPNPDGGGWIGPFAAQFQLQELVFNYNQTYHEPPPPPPQLPELPILFHPEATIPTQSALHRPDNPLWFLELPLPKSTSACADGRGWDFETGDGAYDDWAGTGLFAGQRLIGPVYGNNVDIERMNPPGYIPGLADAGVGGDYWQFSRGVNQHGDYWIGSMDVRRDWTVMPGLTRPDTDTGTLISPEFVITADHVDFWIGGGSDVSQRVQLEVEPLKPTDSAAYDGIGVSELMGPMPPLTDGAFIVVRASSALSPESEYMRRRVSWNVSDFLAYKARIVVVDDNRTTLGMAHINTDYIRCTNQITASRALSKNVGDTTKPIPLWGLTDTHNHAVDNLTFGGHLMWGDVSDSLASVYNCQNPLPAITDKNNNVVRPAINQPAADLYCNIQPDVVAGLSAEIIGACAIVSTALLAIPFVGEGLSAAFMGTCTASVLVASTTLLTTNVVQGVMFHGAFEPTSGAINFGAWLSGPFVAAGVNDPGFSFKHQAGLIETLDGDEPTDGTHSGHNLGELHQQYQYQMITRAWQGGLRLITINALNSRLVQWLMDGRSDYGDWQAVHDTLEAVKRLTAGPADPVYNQGPLYGIAQIATSPSQARSIIGSGQIAIILATELDELGKTRDAATMTMYGHPGQQDSDDLQVDDLYNLGFREITAIHGIDNPLGGSAMFNDIYMVSGRYHNLTLDQSGQADGTWIPWNPSLPFFVPAVFPFPFALMGLGAISVGQELASPTPCLDDAGCPWNEEAAGMFLPATADPLNPDWIGGYPQITYRVGFSGSSPMASYMDGGIWARLDDLGGSNYSQTQAIWGPVQFNNLGWIIGAAPGQNSPSRCSLQGMVFPQNLSDLTGAAQTPSVIDRYAQNTRAHFNQDGLTDAGVEFLREMMRNGMIVDLDHFSQKSRVDAYNVATEFEGQSFPADIAPGPLWGYPTMGIHTNVRGVDRSGPVPFEKRSEAGYMCETDRTAVEFDHIRLTGGVVSPGMNGNVVREFPSGGLTLPDSGVVLSLPTDVNNDCDFSSKAWSMRYLEMVKLMGGHGVTPSTDMNGLQPQMGARYGQMACHKWSGSLNDKQTRASSGGNPWDNWPADFQADPHCWANGSEGGLDPTCPGQTQVDRQMSEGSGVVYDDYASRPNIIPTDAGIPGLTWVNARTANELREDLSPRFAADEFVAVGVSKQIRPLIKFKNTTQPNLTGWDFNLDGFKHIGMYPDLLQDVRNTGMTWEELGPAFDSAEDYIEMWEIDCATAENWRVQNHLPPRGCQ